MGGTGYGTRQVGAWGKPRLLQSSTLTERVTTAFGQRPPTRKAPVLFLRPQTPGLYVPLIQGALGGLCSLKERGCTKPVPYVTSVGRPLPISSLRPPQEGGPSTVGRQSGSTPPEQAWVYTVYRTRAELFCRGADYSAAGADYSAAGPHYSSAWPPGGPRVVCVISYSIQTPS